MKDLNEREREGGGENGGAADLMIISGEKPCVLLLFDPRPYFPHMLPILEKSFTVLLLMKGSPLTEDGVVIEAAIAARTEALVGSVASARLIESLPNLRLIACMTAGLDGIDLDACRRRGIAVSSVPSVSSDDVADLAILLMLAASSRRHICDAHHVRKVSGQRRVGIIGLGGIGKCIAKRAIAFDCSIAYHAKSVKPNVPFTYYNNIVELAKNCDVLFVACALTHETKQMVDKNVFDALGPEGILVNIARGSILNEVELIAALRDGRLGFAGLDVFENEPHINMDLLKMHNVVLSPHIGNATIETRRAMVELVVANLEAFFSGKPLITPIN